MDNKRELIIRLKLDRSQAKAALSDHHAEEKRTIDAVVGAAKAGEKAKQDAVEQTSKTRKAASEKAVQGEKAVKDATKDTTKATNDLLSAVDGMVAGYGRLRIANDVLANVTQATAAAGSEVKRITQDFIQQRDALRELAAVLDKMGNSHFTRDQLAFAAKAGMSPQEANAFRTGFRGEAQQYLGKFTSESEFNQFEAEAARHAVRMSIPPDIAARAAGSVIRAAPQGTTAHSAMTTLGQSVGTMAAGSGSAADFSENFSRTVSAMVGPSNAFKTPQEAAAAVRMMNEFNSKEAFTELQAIRAGFLDLKPEQQKQLGIDAKTPFFDAIRQVSAKAGEAQATKGLTLDEFLKLYFGDARTRRGLSVGVERGVGGGVIDMALRDAAKIGAGQTEAENSRFFSDPTQSGFLRQAQAARVAAEASQQRVQDQVLLEPFMEQARAVLAGPRQSPLKQFNYALNDNFPFLGRIRAMMGQDMNAAQTDEFGVARGAIEARARGAGVKFDSPSGLGELLSSQRTMESYLARLVEATLRAEAKQDRHAPPVPAPMNGRPPTLNMRP